VLVQRPPSATRDAGSKVDGAPCTILPVHARSGEQAAATPWFLGARQLLVVGGRSSEWGRERVEPGPGQVRTAEEMSSGVGENRAWPASGGAGRFESGDRVSGG
jgi:hypothetical protein